MTNKAYIEDRVWQDPDAPAEQVKVKLLDNGDGTYSVATANASPAAVTGTFWQATQPVSFSWDGLTDTQLRANALPVSGTFWPATQPVSIATTVPVSGPATDAQLRATALPVSAASLPLPAGAATAAGLAGIVAALGLPAQAGGAVSVSNFPATQPVSLAAPVDVTGPLTDAQLRSVAVSVSMASTTVTGSVAVTGPVTDTQLRAAALPVSMAAAPLPAGASTEATLALIKAKTDNIDVALSTRAVTGLTDTQLRAAAIPVSLASTTVTGTVAVSGAFWQATQPVSLASLPALVAGSAIIGKVDQGAAGAAAWKVDGSGVTQPVSGTFYQSTQPVSFTWAGLTDTQLRASAIAVSLTSTTVTGSVAVTGPATDAQMRASALPVSLAALPSLPAGTNTIGGVTIPDLTASGSLAALNATLALAINQAGGAAVEISGTWAGTISFEGTVSGSVWNPINGTASSTSTPGTSTTVNGLYRLTPAGLSQIRVNMIAFGSGSATISMRSAVGTGGTFANQILPTKNTDGVSSQAIKAASTAAAAADQAAVVSLSPNSPVPLAALTKGTQGATGATTQDLKDAGRSARTITLDAFAVAVTAETLNTMSYSADNGTLTTGTSYTVTAGKRLRVQSIMASQHTITGNTTAVNVTVRLRANNAGAALVSSPVQMVLSVPGIGIANGSASAVSMAVPDGWEFTAGAGIAFTTQCAGFVATLAAPKVNITLIGYEY